MHSEKAIFDYVGRAAARDSVRMIARERLDGHGSPTAETKSVTLDRQAAFLRSKIGGLRGVSIRSRSAQLLRHSSPFRSRHPESTLSRILSISTPTENTRPREPAAGRRDVAHQLCACRRRDSDCVGSSYCTLCNNRICETAWPLSLPRDRLFFHSETEDADRRHRTGYAVRHPHRRRRSPVAVPVSEWLLAFAMLIFTALALIKRYVELAVRLDADLPDPSNRSSRKSNLSIVATLAAGAAFNAVTVLHCIRVQLRPQKIGLPGVPSFLRSHRLFRCNRRNHDSRFDGILKTKLQAFGPSKPETLQSQISSRLEKSTLAQWLGGLFTDDYFA
jgi:hypothetical protein